MCDYPKDELFDMNMGRSNLIYVESVSLKNISSTAFIKSQKKSYIEKKTTMQ